MDEKEFPDVTCKTESGRRVGVEMGEWLNEDQTRVRKGMERLEQSILDAIGEQGENQTYNICAIFLSPAGKPIKPADKELFRSQLFDYIDEVDRRWPNEKYWQGRNGYRASTVKVRTCFHKSLLSDHSWLPECKERSSATISE